MKILVRATNWVGDAVLSIPALQAIRKCQPQAEIKILARPWVADIYRGQPYVDGLIIFENRGRHRALAGLECLASELRRERFDTAILLQNAFEAAWIAWRANIPERIGYARDGRGWLLTRAVPLPVPGESPPHESSYYLELLRRAGWIESLPNSRNVRLQLETAALDRAEEALIAAGSLRGRLRIAFAAGAAYGTAKCWPADRYAELAGRLIAEFAADVILFGAASEKEVAARVAGLEPCVINLAGKTAIGDLPAFLARCGLFIGNDSGAMHLAAAVGLPVVAVFGPTDPGGTAPLATMVTVVQRQVACSPCFLRHCPIDHRCMTSVSVTEVLNAARPALQAYAAQRAERKSNGV